MIWVAIRGSRELDGIKAVWHSVGDQDSRGEGASETTPPRDPRWRGLGSIPK